MTLDIDLLTEALDGYEVGGELGRGGWGVVIEGRHRQLGREVAIKQLPRAFAADPEVRARFVSEARLLAALDHPHVVPIYDYVEKDGLCLLVMEKLSGGTVWTRFTTTGLLPDEAVSVVLAACAGLHCAHERDILHRDIKPENLMFSTTGALKVTDFGIAKVLTGKRTMATRAGEVLGTPAYMSPEQAQGADLGPATDVYALGTVLYELLSGRLPFPDEGDALRLLYLHVYEEPEPLSHAAPHVPPGVTEVVMQSLSREPDDRFPSGESFGIALAEAATGAWGPGWLERSELPMVADGRILSAATRPTPAGAAARAPAPATMSANGPDEPARPAPGTEAVPATGAGPASAPRTEAPLPSGPSPARVPVRPSTVIRSSSGPSLVDLDDPAQLDLVPVEQVVERPAPPTAHIATALAAILVALAIAFVGLGSPDRTGTLTPGTVTVAAIDPTTDAVVELDLSQPVIVAGALPEGVAGADEVELSFSAMGAPLGSATAPLAPAPDRSFRAEVDADGSRYLVAGGVTGKINLLLSGGEVGSQEFAAASDQAWPLTAPGAVGIALVLFVLAYAESLLRSLRRGRKRVVGLPGLMIVGALFGLAATVMAWLVAEEEPVAATTLVCAALGAVAGLAAGLAGMRIGRRRRWRG